MKFIITSGLANWNQIHNLCYVLQETSSGSVCVNDVIIQLSVDTLPFGGVEESGYGAYHGK